ncbi:MAG: hypothetical protein KDB68_07870 [Planctomycetes bacterium]|nr:hypothetical protein [Planctomycetota bacterium]
MLRLFFMLVCFCFGGLLLAQAEMDLLRGGTSIADGGIDAISNTGTSPFNLTYTVRNDGTSDLNLTLPVVISGEVNCTVSQLSAPTTPVASGGGETTFTLQVTPTSASGFTFELSITNDDADENPYNITFNGNSGIPSPSSGGGGGNDDCSTGETTGLNLLCWLLLLLPAILGRAFLHKRPTRRDLRRAHD